MKRLLCPRADDDLVRSGAQREARAFARRGDKIDAGPARREPADSGRATDARADAYESESSECGCVRAQALGARGQGNSAFRKLQAGS